MLRLPSIGIQNTSRLMTDVFYGYDHRLKTRDGTFFHTENLTNSDYPVLATRPRRGTVRTLTAPGGLLEKDALAWVDGGTLYYNGLPTGVKGLSSGEKQMVSMGAYLCIFPDKVYFNTADFTDYGSMEAHYESLGDIRYSLCRSDGTDYESIEVGEEEPAEGSVEIWISTAGGASVAMQWSASYGGWVELGTVYTKLSFTSQGDVGSRFSEGDGVEISGADFEPANGSKILYAVGGKANEQADYIVVVGLLEGAFTQESGSVRISRTLPQLDFVCEARNRLWGCYYGNDGEKNINEIYCSALGDFKNWRQYRGLSTDSWAASVGSDGPWTGAVNYLGEPVFFKENCLHQVRVSGAGAHALTETICRGVQKGSHKSLQVVGETLFYKSRTDVCSWQGGFPVGVSAALGDGRYYDAAAGSFGQKYYISMRDAAGSWSLFVLDTDKGLWMREDALHALQLARVDDELYCIDADSGALLALNGTAGEQEGTLRWEAVTGIQYYEYPDRKYVSRYNIRLKMAEDAAAQIELQYDSDGTWVPSGTVRYAGIGTVTVPIRPRRCDHLQVRLAGHGEAKILSIARILEVGSDK